MSINICRSNTDPFYRYKMPPIQAKVEGKGNGIKTNIMNAADVARALNRPVSYIIKYFGFELGAQTTIDEAKDRYLVNGVHEPGKLQDTLDGFINKFVLCGSCQNPETEIIIKNGSDLQRDCKACGKITSMDPRHKLYSYILKNPPGSGGSSSGSKKSKKKAATASANVVGGGVSISDIAQENQGINTELNKKSKNKAKDDEDDELARKINAAASNLEKIEVKDDDWAVDMSEEAIRKRALEGSGAEPLSPELVKLEEYGEWADNQEEFPSDVELYKKAVEMDLVQDPRLACVIPQIMFEDEDIVSEIAEHAPFFIKLINNRPEFEKHFLGGIERFLGIQHPELIPLLPKILVQIYNNDICSEESIMHFGTTCSKKFVPKPISKKVRKSAKPFITWLKSAEEDDEEEDDE
ncbi:probable Eukaryotic translation initiation factor 5 [Saccharomycodes ludwigii]|uniref:Probable Eukaryotic translation initiation factor 5 n=1 Tax=Saccharomycodes ludwigii TaxID=36035 RepID=A0A376B923_9ASCO|nr:hypothetical protein SCDLUD_000106 [Saccharomycodes ludwigii]KAH3902527.1 hypothetical protein SCDLUD_000106 [Saccharomycodes ludwigii]SSD61176.1 probable Eukaryotic translation initiation factor 5 [Saccharomycodes ludwigii]